MASSILYPAIIDASMPAFVVRPNVENVCRIYFSLSKFNASTDFSSVHVSIKKQATAENVVNQTDGNNLYRATGIILNVPATPVPLENNLYYIELADSNLKTQDGDYSGWIPGTLYQIQLRLSQVDYDESIGQAAWLNENANYFSEWSTICILKAISTQYLTSRYLLSNNTEYDSRNSLGVVYDLKATDLYFKYNRETADKEDLYSYRVKLMNAAGSAILEQSDILYTNRYVNSDELKYIIKYDLQNNTNYKIVIDLQTINDYFQTVIIDVLTVFSSAAQTTLDIYTVENDNGYMNYSSESLESDDGRVLIYINGTESAVGATEKYILRRTDSKNNFTIWEDIAELELSGSTISYEYSDFTIESGVFYKYGLQIVDEDGERGVLKITPNPIIREFEYSFLLGQDGQQLRLMFNNDMNSFNFNLDESVQKTFDIYPVVNKLGATKYRSFPITGLISFQMDENHLFLTKEEIYKYQAILDLYESRPTTTSSQIYNRTYERDFRNKVFDFLLNGKPKLFKSATEGNILVRITNVSCTPNQTLGRMIYSFSSTGTEINDTAVEKLNRYKITGKGVNNPQHISSGHESHLPE